MPSSPDEIKLKNLFFSINTFLAVLVWRITGPFNVGLFLFLVCGRRPCHPTLKGHGTYNYPHFVKLIMSVVVCHGANYPYNASRKKKKKSKLQCESEACA